MAWSYDRLWIMLIQRKMKRTQLKEAAHISSVALAKMGKNLPITMESLGKICTALDCCIEDIVEFIPDEKAGDADEDHAI